jgi:hypothetical protein
MRTPPRTLVAALLVLALAASTAPSEVSGGPDESIGVSGHWVIEVRDPDGTLVTRREFHNALSGASRLSEYLRGVFTPGPMRVEVSCQLATCVNPCPIGCSITEARAIGVATPSLFKNLTVTTLPTGYQMQGFAVASTDGAISTVKSFVGLCIPTVAPANCLVSQVSNSLTSTGLSPPVPVASGQQVLVTVTIGFATVAPPPATTSQSAPARR